MWQEPWDRLPLTRQEVFALVFRWPVTPVSLKQPLPCLPLAQMPHGPLCIPAFGIYVWFIQHYPVPGLLG